MLEALYGFVGIQRSNCFISYQAPNRALLRQPLLFCVGFQGCAMPRGRVARGIFPLIADSLGAGISRAKNDATKLSGSFYGGSRGFGV